MEKNGAALPSLLCIKFPQMNEYEELKLDEYHDDE